MLEISLLGFILQIERVKMNLTCVFIIKEWLLPSNVCEIQVFLGFANFYCRFIKKFLRIVRGLTKMLKENIQGKFQEINFILKPKAKESFCLLQNAFITVSMLRHFDLLLPICIETDSSDFAISAILS